MRMVELLNLVAQAYDPNLDWGSVYDLKNGDLMYAGSQIDVGDSLAVFVINELYENYNPNSHTYNQLLYGVRRMESAKHDLDRVIEALHTRLREEVAA